MRLHKKHITINLLKCTIPGSLGLYFLHRIVHLIKGKRRQECELLRQTHKGGTIYEHGCIGETGEPYRRR